MFDTHLVQTLHNNFQIEIISYPIQQSPIQYKLIKHFITMLCYHKLDTGSVETAQGCNILLFTQT